MLKSVKPISLLSLLLLAGFASFGAVLPTPALPAIASYFHHTTSQTEAVISIYLVGYALGQLIYGPISNRFGRKKPLMTGVVIALIGSVLGAFAAHQHFFDLFIVSRFIFAIGAAACLVIAMILIKDCNDEINARKTFSKVVLTFAFVPFLASTLGGVLTHYFNWQILNALLIVYAIILLLLVQTLPETLPDENKLLLSLRYFLNSYKTLFKNFEYIRLIFLFSLASAASYVFNALAPILVIKTMGLTPALYGYLSIIPSIGILIGGLVSTRFAHKIKAKTFITVGISLIVISSFALCALFGAGESNLIALYAMAIILFIGHALIIPNAGMQALSQISDHGNGTSVMNASALFLGSALVSVGGVFIDTTPLLALPIILLAIGLVATLLNLIKRSTQQC